LYDPSSSDVIDWLANSKVFRINNDDIPRIFLGMNLKIEFNNDYPNVKSVWYRKGGASKLINSNNQSLCNYSTQELYALSHYFHRKKSSIRKLGTSELFSSNKLSILSEFRECGLDIPPTLVTSSKEDLIMFKKQYGDIVVKPLSEGVSFQKDNFNYKIYTEDLSEDFIVTLNEYFFPSLFQKKIIKKFEIRSFYLNGKIYSTAIFISKKVKEEVDHRIHLQLNELRRVPYQLPAEVESKMKLVMEKLSFETGSFDIIKSYDGKYYFLELNQSGQFGAISEVCNFYIEKAIAKYLMNEI
jgi:ATP-GRASP peptide maturase of grasp-with-spasm system